MRLEEHEVEEFKKHNQIINRVWGKVAALDTLSGILSNAFATVLFTGVTFSLGALFVITGIDDLKIGQLVSIIAYCRLLYGKINSIFKLRLITKSSKQSMRKSFLIWI